MRNRAGIQLPLYRRVKPEIHVERKTVWWFSRYLRTRWFVWKDCSTELVIEIVYWFVRYLVGWLISWLVNWLLR
jgi:hypothetical protein